jgi:MATE family multidrug resistance protein
MSEVPSQSDPAASPGVSKTKSMGREVLDLAWPIIGLNILQVLSLAVDTAMVGRSGNAENSLIGLGYASQLMFLLMMVMIGLTVGTVASMARARGRGELETAQHIFQQSLQLTCLLGVGVAVVGNLLAVPLLRTLGADETTMGPALDYFRPLLVGVVFAYLTMVFAASLRAMGNTRVAFMVSLAMNGLNVVFNYGLILGNFGLPALGNTGAALGTVLSQCIAVILMVGVLRRGVVPELKLFFRLRAFDKAVTRNLFRIGWPAALDMLVLNASLLLTVGLLGRIDQAAVGAHSIGLRVQLLAFVPGIGVSQAIGALVGQALGANRLEDARAVLRSGLVLCVGIMTTLGLVLLIFADSIVGLFGVEVGTPIRVLAVEWMQLLSYMMPASAISIAVGGLLQGAGATMISLRINAATSIGLLMPCAYVLGNVVGWGAVGVWMAFPISSVVRATWTVTAYRRGNWAQARA